MLNHDVPTAAAARPGIRELLVERARERRQIAPDKRLTPEVASAPVLCPGALPAGLLEKAKEYELWPIRPSVKLKNKLVWNRAKRIWGFSFPKPFVALKGQDINRPPKNFAFEASRPNDANSGAPWRDLPENFGPYTT